MRVAAGQGFPGGKHVTLVAARVGAVSLVHDDNGVYDVTVNEVHPEVGSA